MSFVAIMLGVITGLALASVYVLISLSLTIVLAASGVFNFVQGTIVMLGTVFAYVLGVWLGWAPLFIAAAIIGLGVAAGLLTHLLAVWPAIGRSKSFSHTTVLTTIGLGTAVNAAVALAFGSESYPVTPFVAEEPLHFGSIPVRPIYLVMVVSGLLITLLFERIVQRTSLGLIYRVTLEDPEGALLAGIDTRKVIAVAFGTAGGIAAAAGFLVAPMIQASAFSAQEMAFYGFAGMAIGGFGSFGGALLGGLITGLISGVIPAIGDPDLTLPILWVVVVTILLLRPSGLMGSAGLFGSAKLREI